MATVGIGFIGTGFARTVQMPAFAACGNAKILSVASGSIENARAAATQFGASHFTGDWRETVDHADVDLVCITTPPSMHCEMALYAIERGKHVLCEKPMAMNAEEAGRMAEAADEKRILALIDHELRFLPGRIAARNKLRDGAVGKIRHVKTTFRAPHRGNPDLPFNWWSDVKFGGGALGAINSHILDSLNWFLDSDVSSVACQLHTHMKERRDAAGNMREVTTDDEANMLLRFASGGLTDDATGLVSVSMTEGPDYLHRMDFYGEDGAIRVEHDGAVFISRRGEDKWSDLKADLGPRDPAIRDTGFAHAFRFFAPRIVEAVVSGSSLEEAASFRDGLRVQKVLDAARRSSAEASTIWLN